MPAPTITYVVDERYVRLATSAVLRHFRPRRYALLGSVLLVLVGALAPSGWAGFVTALVVWLAILAFATVFWRRSIRGSVVGPTPIGSTVAARLEDDGLWLATPLSTSVTSYRAFRRAELDGDAVVLVRRFGRAVNVLPRELLPGAAFGELSARVGAAGHEPGAPVAPSAPTLP